jgi:UDP-N-acetylglucosamine--N-acetylmuramyl-(pentapeptide) pyrophosphoryl-undecaprenol N-acetylglucosamine transferase
VEGYHIKLLDVEGFVRVSLWRKIVALFKFLRGFLDVFFFIRKFAPDIVIGTGGYASFLPVVAARLLSVPVVILEQNTIPGAANLALARLAKKVCVTYEGTITNFPMDRALLTGNPIRGSILSGKRATAIEVFSLKPNRFTILVFGGSRGARSINNAVVESLAHLEDIKGAIQFLHQTGQDDYETVRAGYQRRGYSGTITPFIYKMQHAYAVCDLVVSRAGATTLAEITSVGAPSILIPYPHSAGGHQEANAVRLAENGAAVVIREADLSGPVLAQKIRELFGDESKRKTLKSGALALGRPHAAARVAEVAASLIKRSRVKGVRPLLFCSFKFVAKFKEQNKRGLTPLTPLTPLTITEVKEQNKRGLTTLTTLTPLTITEVKEQNKKDQTPLTSAWGLTSERVCGLTPLSLLSPLSSPSRREVLSYV